MIHSESLQKLVDAVRRGRIKGERSHTALGISSATFWRWVREAERRGVRFHKNRRGGNIATPAQPWRIKSYGPFQGAP